MTKRKIILLTAAAVIAGVTMFLAHALMTPQQAQTEAAAEPASEVLAAARDLPTGTILKESDVKWIAWPADAQNSNLFARGKADKSALLGSVLRQGAHTGQPIMTGDIVNPHDQGFLAAVLAPGMRAMSISVNPGGEVAGFIFPGDRVDVILSHSVSRKDDPDLLDRHMSETVLKNIRVLALDQKSDDQTNDPKVAQLATLEVSPREAERLALASQLGILSLSLRSLAANDTLSDPPTPDQLPAAALDTVASQTWDSDISQAFPAPGRDDSLLQKVQVMRGKDTSETTFQRRR